jgi:hypothetical protein
VRRQLLVAVLGAMLVSSTTAAAGPPTGYRCGKGGSAKPGKGCRCPRGKVSARSRKNAAICRKVVTSEPPPATPAWIAVLPGGNEWFAEYVAGWIGKDRRDEPPDEAASDQDDDGAAVSAEATMSESLGGEGLCVGYPARLAKPRELTSLTSDQVKAGVREVKREVLACGAQHRDATGTVKLHVTVAAAGGNPTAVEVVIAPDPELGTCAATAMHAATFPAAERDTSFTYPFNF